MIKTIFVLMSLLSFSIFAEDKFIEAKGRFFSQEGDSYAFIKKQLIRNAFADAISKKLKEMGLDQDLFWNKYDEKFNKYFGAHQEKIDKRFGVEEGKSLSAKEKKRYRTALRYKKLSLKENYGGIKRAIQSYSVKRITRSPKHPELRYIRLQAKVDPRLISALFLSFSREEGEALAKKLYLTTKIELENLSWTDIGVASDKEIITALNNSWLKSTASQFKDLVTESVETDKDLELKLSTHLKTEEKKLSEEEPTPNKDGLWLKISVHIKKISEDSLAQKRDFRISGDFILVDLSQKQLLYSHDFSSSVQQFPYGDNSKLASNIASFIYNLPQSQLGRTARNLFNKGGVQKLLYVEVNNISSMQELLEITDIITQKGLIKQFHPSISSYTGETGKIQLGYQGAKEDAISLLEKLDSTKLSNSKFLRFSKEENSVSLNIR